MRISDNMTIGYLTRSNAHLRNELTVNARKASSGARISSPSDDPVGAARLARVQAGLDRAAAYKSVISSATEDAAIAESALAGAQDILKRAQEIALLGSTASTSAQSRLDMGKEVAQLKAQILSVGNAKGANGYLFGGTASGVAPFSPAGAFIGNANARNLEIASGVTVPVNVSGSKAFTVAGGRDIYADLTALETALNTNNSDGVAATILTIEAGHTQLSGARSDAGLILSRLQVAEEGHSSSEITLAQARADIVDIDPSEAYTAFSNTQRALDQSITVTRNILSILASTKLQ